MKTLILIFATLLSFEAFANVPGFSPVDKNSVEYQNYFEARKRAIEYIKNGAPKFNEEIVRQMGASAINALLLTEFYVLTAPYAKECTSETRFFVYSKIPNKIFVCPQVRLEMDRQLSSEESDVIAQLIVHESLHLIGRSNECDATKFELGVMYQSVGIKDFSNRDSYRSKCGSFGPYDNMALADSNSRSNYVSSARRSSR